MSLIGFDDNFHARHLTPAITTVRPVDEVGRMAAEVLSQILAGVEPAATEFVVLTHLVVRDSVGPPPVRARASKERIEVAR